MTTLPIGRAFTMVQDRIYAIPSAMLKYYEQGAGTLEVSNDNVTYTAPLVLGELTGKFARSTGGTTIISLFHQ